MKTKVVSLLLMLMVAISGIAQTFTVDGLIYEVISTSPNEVRLTGGTPPTSDLVIPDLVSDGVDSFAVVALGNTAFENAGLTSVSFPNTLRELGQITFRFNALTNVVIPEGITIIPQRCFSNNDLVNVTLPSTLENIGFRAFERNEITSVTFPESVTTIEGFAFDLNSLTELTFPANLISIGAEAFNRNSLTDVTALGTMPPTIQNNSFANRAGIRLFVPEGSEQDYLNAGWTGFAGINDDVILTQFTVDQITYRITSTSLNEVETFATTTSGSIVVPQTVSNDGQEYTVTAIGINSLRQRALTAVTLPSTLKEIKQEGLSRNPITSITIPEGVTSLGDGVFVFCDLQSIIIPNSVTAIGRDAFRGNSSLSQATLPTGIETLERGLFRGANLSAIEIPESVTTIAFEAFINNSLTSVTIPNAVQNIAADAFENNDIATLSLGTGLQTIGSQAFNNNPLNTIASLNNTPPSIENTSFGNNRGAIDLTIPEGTEIAYANAGWTGFSTVNGVQPLDVGNTFDVQGLLYTIVSLSPNEVHSTGGSNIPTDLIVPESVVIQDVTFSVTGVGDGAFMEAGITSVSLPSTLQVIGVSAFAINQLTAVSIPEGVTELPSRCFSVNNLTTVTFPTSLETIGFRAFENNDLTTLLLPENLQSIDQLAFRGSSINTINSLNPTPPSVVLGTENDSFNNENDIDLTVPSGTEVAYEAAGWVGFNSLNGVINFEVGDTFIQNNLNYTVTSVGPNKVTITGGTEIPQDLVIDASVSSGGSDFMVTAIGSGAFDASGLTSVILPDTIESIGAVAFRSNQLNSIVFPDSLVSIGGQSFRNNQLTSITFPGSVSSINFRAFEGNPIAEITALGSVPATITTGDNDTFSNRSNIALFIPAGTTQDYIDGDWTGFDSITEFDIDIAIAPKVILQGAATNPIAGEESLMRDSLRENGLLPTTSPYGDGATVDPAVFNTTGADAIVDWVLIELRSGADNDNTTIVASQAAFLQRDGDIVDLDGASLITFNVDAGDYFLAIKHRNHIGILTAVSSPLGSSLSLFDFTQDAAFAKGENLALTQVNGTFAMIAGDADGSSQILNTDITEALGLAGGGQAYSSADADMNGFVLNSDIQLLVLANSGTVQQFD